MSKIEYRSRRPTAYQRVYIVRGARVCVMMSLLAFTPIMEITKTLYVTDRAAWRQWLAKHHEKETEVWLIYFRKGTCKPRIPYNHAVEEALCYGWIDSTVKTIDHERFAQRFSVRKRASVLSQLNKERVRMLIAQQQMTPAGLAAIAHVFEPDKDQTESFTIPADILQPLQANKEAWKNFQQFPAAYQRIRIAYIESRKRHGQEPFQRALQHFIAMSSKNKRFGTAQDEL